MTILLFENIAVEILVGVLLVLAVRFLFGRRLGPRLCRMLWLVVMVRALVPWSLPLPYHPGGIFVSSMERFAATEYAETEISPKNFNFETKTEPHVSETIFAVDAIPLTPTNSIFRTEYLLPGLWFLGFATVLVTATLRNRRIVARAERRPTPVPDWVQAIFLETRQTLRLKIWPVLIVTPHVPTPCLVGALRPRILIPEALLDDDQDAVRYMILHEMVHLKHGDIAFSWLWTLTVAVHWFNPLFWLLDRLVKLDCEAACDDRVLDLLENPQRKEYGLSLLRIMQTLNPPPGTYAPGSCAVIENSSHLERRLNMMTLHRRPTLRRTLCGTLVLLLLAGFTLTGYAAPKLISSEKAKMIGYVEDFFMNNYRDVTMRKSLEWGDVQTEKNGNLSIRYRYIALIWDKERIEENKVWTFTKDGKYVSVENVEGFPKKIEVEKPDTSTKAGLQKLVEKFFTQNYRDITARKTIEWGERKISRNDDGKELARISYKYEATIRGGDKIVQHKTWAFDKDGEFVSVEDVEEEKSNEKAVKPDPKASKLAAAGGWRLFMQGKPDEAEPKFQEAVRLDPKNANAYQGLGWAQTNLGMTDEAKKTFEQCLKLDPKNAAALNGLGVIARNEGDEKTMLDVWNRAVDADKKATGPMAGLAEFYEKKGDKKTAAKYYKMWVDADPSDQNAKEGLKRVAP